MDEIRYASPRPIVGRWPGCQGLSDSRGGSLHLNAFIRVVTFIGVDIGISIEIGIESIPMPIPNIRLSNSHELHVH